MPLFSFEFDSSAQQELQLVSSIRTRVRPVGLMGLRTADPTKKSGQDSTHGEADTRGLSEEESCSITMASGGIGQWWFLKVVRTWAQPRQDGSVM